ncbi:helix-turn-helix domain-containing protein [Streptosporangium lutulentum]
MVVFLQRPGGQSQFSVAARTPKPRHDGLRELLDAVVADPAADHSLPALAVRGGFSVRHLTRLFRSQIGSTPAAYVESVRFEAARALLEAGETVTAAAGRTGLGSEESLRRIFHRHLGVPPSSYRARFHSSGGSRASEKIRRIGGARPRAGRGEARAATVPDGRGSPGVPVGGTPDDVVERRLTSRGWRS